MIDGALLKKCEEIAQISNTFHLVCFPKTEPGKWGCSLIEGGEFIWGVNADDAMQLAIEEYNAKKQP